MLPPSHRQRVIALLVRWLQLSWAVLVWIPPSKVLIKSYSSEVDYWKTIFDGAYLTIYGKQIRDCLELHFLLFFQFTGITILIHLSICLVVRFVVWSQFLFVFFQYYLYRHMFLRVIWERFDSHKFLYCFFYLLNLYRYF